MAPFRSKATPIGSYKRPQAVRYSPMHLIPALNLTRFNSFSPKLQKLKEKLKAARDAIHELELQAANNQHQLYLEWDSLSLGSEIAKDRHNELAIDQKEWYRDLRNRHKQRIYKLEVEIMKESDYSNWRTWTPIELLLRWKSGNMDYSIFKDHEATKEVHAAFELETGLQVPDPKTIALVSTQVAAGWYKTPIESIDWIPRKPEPDYVDGDFSADDSSSRSGYVPGYSLQNTFTAGNKPNKHFKPLSEDKLRGEIHYIYKRKAEEMDRGQESETEMYGDEKPPAGDVVNEPSYAEHPKSSRHWANKYPHRDYSDAELDDLAAKANTSEKRKKLVPMIAGRTSSRMIVAEEYAD